MFNDTNYLDLLQGLQKVGPGEYVWKVKYGEPSEKENGMKNQFMIGSVDPQTGGFSFAPNPKLHPTRQSAHKEAERLATSFPGKRFVVAQIVGSVVANGVTWD
jgi:hypothetical protein